MARLNFFCNLDVLSVLLEMDAEHEYPENGLTVDLIDIPYYLVFTSNEENMTMHVMGRGIVHSLTEDGVLKCRLTVDKKTGKGNAETRLLQGDNDDDFVKENLTALLAACIRISCYSQEHRLPESYPDMDPEAAGILLSLEDGNINHRVVTGEDRPDLMCKFLFGDAQMMRPYVDDFIENSINEFLPLEDKIEKAEDGDSDLMMELANLYFNGSDETEADPEKAVYWYEKLARTDNPIAQYNMGLFCAKGYGTTRNYEVAACWMEKAAENGDEDASEEAKLYRKMADAEAFAAAGDAQAQADLAHGLMKLGGMNLPGIENDYSECIAMAEKSADHHNGAGLWILGLAYEHGRGVRQDLSEAAKLYQRGADAGNADCQNSLAAMYMNGNPIKKDMAKGFELTQKSALQGNGLAMYNLGRCYQFGHGVEESLESAVEWYEKSLKVRPDPELEMKLAGFKQILQMQSDSADAPEEHELPAGYMAALEKANHDFKLEDDTLVKYSGSEASVNVPYNLRTIASCAFMFSDHLVSVNITPNIATIGEKAFMGCHALEKVTLPNTLEEIHDYGFANCEKIAAIDLPEGMTAIGECAFINCAGIQSLVIPAGIKVIRACAFQNCSGLERVVLPEGLTTIEQEAFAECFALKEMNFPSTLTTIGYDAFRGCALLPDVPESTQEKCGPDTNDLSSFFSMLMGDAPVQDDEDDYTSDDRSRMIRRARKELISCVEMSGYFDNGQAGQDWENSNIVFDKISYDKENNIFSVLTSVHGIKRDAVSLAESLKPHQTLMLRFDGQTDQAAQIFTQNGILIGHLVNASWMEPVQALLGQEAARIIVCEVDHMKTRAQRGPRTRVPLLAVRIEIKIDETENQETDDKKYGCVLLRLGGDQLKIWAQKLNVSYLDLPLKTAKLVFELYNRMKEEYEKDPEEYPGYAGLDNLDKEIMAARRSMRASMQAGMSYSHDIEEENFAEYMREMCRREPKRYAAVESLIPAYADSPADVLEDCIVKENTCCWWNLTRISQDEFNQIDGYSHWYDILELYGNDPLPFDLDDPDIVSIFGFEKFEAFADLSYGC